MSGTLLLSEISNHVLRLTLHHPASRNSLSDVMMTSLVSALEHAAADPQVRVIVIAATGPAYCSGHNLKDITVRRQDADGGANYFKSLMSQCSALMQSIVLHPKPVIAEVQGIASAAGCQLVASCDLAIASEAASFCTPGVNIGLFCSTPMVALSRNISPKHAMEMLLTGDRLPARDALRMGLINRVVSANELVEETTRLAQKIASKALTTLKTGKEAFYRQLEMPLADAYAYTSQVMVENLLRGDACEGIDAFLDKRQPRWPD